MREKQIWIKVLAIFAIVLAQVPANVLASMWQTNKCGMPCCAGKLQDSEPKKSCCSKSSGLSNSVGQSDPCGCKISRSTAPIPSTEAVASSTAPLFIEIVADNPMVSSNTIQLPAKQAVFGIYGTDSGPPVGQSHRAWIGRAPPVLVV